MKMRISFTVDIDAAMIDKLSARADRAGFTGDTDKALARAWLQEKGESELYADDLDEAEGAADGN